jgi:hypothetical protein
MKKSHAIVFIGCGTGRCGTLSLAKLIDGCEDAVCTHERRPLLPWIFKEDLFQERLSHFSNATASLIGDVAYFYLPYLEPFIQIIPDIKIICLERDRQGVINSYMSKAQWWNHWRNNDAADWVDNNLWDVTFPKYDSRDKSKAIGTYWDDYRRKIRIVAKTHPKNIRIFHIDVLNTKRGLKRIFDFLEISEENRRYPEKRQYNTKKLAGFATQKEAIKWTKRLFLAKRDIESMIPSGDIFILVDQEKVKQDLVTSERHVIPFLERDGQYWGPPSDGLTGICELERLRRAGARFIVFVWPSFWWLDFYSELRSHLLSRFRCVLRNDRVIVFDLRL